MQRILVTGGCGFIGSNFVRMVVRDHPGVRVTVLDKLTYAANPESVADLPHDRVRLVVGDICDAALLGSLVPGHDAVVNFAAETHNDNSVADPEPFVRTNVEGTMRLLEAARATGVRLHQVSTDEVFGDLPLGGSERFTEDSPFDPNSPYSSSKAASDLLVRAWVRTYGVRATISNCSNNYGPYQHAEKFVPRQAIRLMRGEPACLYGDGLNVRAWIHVEDQCRAVWDILERGEVGRTYLVGADCERSNREVLAAIMRATGRAGAEVRHVADRPAHDRRLAIDSSRLRRELGWRPLHTDFDEGLAQTVAWYAAHEPWWRDAHAAAEARYAEQGR